MTKSAEDIVLHTGTVMGMNVTMAESIVGKYKRGESVQPNPLIYSRYSLLINLSLATITPERIKICCFPSVTCSARPTTFSSICCFPSTPGMVSGRMTSFIIKTVVDSIIYTGVIFIVVFMAVTVQTFHQFIDFFYFFIFRFTPLFLYCYCCALESGKPPFFVA